MADIHTDTLYHHLRSHHGNRHAKANGYRAQFFFRLEQRTVLEHLHPQARPIVDIACGSGLMLAPLAGHSGVYGLDFNRQACTAALGNALPTLRGDALQLPFAEGSVAQFINCQFLNQQTPADARRFIEQLAQAMRPGGRSVILWRNGSSLIHRAAHRLFCWLDRRRDAPVFPQYLHPLHHIEQYARNTGLTIINKAITLPLPFTRTIAPNHWLSAVLGASFLLVIGKPDEASGEH